MTYPAPNVTESTFARVVQITRFTAQTKSVAHALMVKRQSAADVAAAFKLRTQRVYAIRRQFLTAYVRLLGYPADWIRAEVVAPALMLDAFLADVEVERLKVTSSS